MAITLRFDQTAQCEEQKTTTAFTVSTKKMYITIIQPCDMVNKKQLLRISTFCELQIMLFSC